MELVNQDAVTGLIKQIVLSYLQENKPLPRTAKLTKQVRQDYFHGKSAEWIRTFIFDAYPETNEANGGWALNPRATEHGRTTTILIKPAIKWLNDHEYQIDWNEQLPKVRR